MRLAVVKFIFTIIIFVCWSTAVSISNDVQIAVDFPDHMNESFQHLCEDDKISLNFSNAIISSIDQDFISSSLITCLNLTGNHIQNIGKGAFNKLPNLTQLFLSNNRFSNSEELFKFGGHDKLQVLIMNSAVDLDTYCLNYDYYRTVQIFGGYPNLEILSLRKNCLNDMQFSPEKTPFSGSYYTTASTQRIPFPKLKILDFSGNGISDTKFLKLLSNSLHFLDLHDNSLETFIDLNKITNKLFALNLNNNHFRYIIKWYGIKYSLSVSGMKELHYLSISGNEIDFIGSDAFPNDNKLLYLNLSANNINYLNPHTFAKLQYLNTLDLSSNKLENVPQISKKIGISILYINCNNIKKLISHTFVHMPKLTKLLLGENQINETDVNAFANLSVLEELDLSRNMLSSLPEGWTESLVSLKYLDLSDNKLISLESLSLTNALPLIEIYLTMNPLEYLNVGYFENLPQNLTINLIKKSRFAKWKRNKIDPGLGSNALFVTPLPLQLLSFGDGLITALLIFTFCNYNGNVVTFFRVSVTNLTVTFIVTLVILHNCL